ncbi:MAG: type VI secretion system-associated FHA domain protein TagH [Pseudomonadota bacterium]
MLRIENHATLDTGGPVTLKLQGKGAQIGRKSGNDWVLPDQSRHISGHHFDITFKGDQYFLTDVSSNGTFLHGERYRIDGPHQIEDGDRFTVGHYIIRAEIVADGEPAVTDPPAAVPEPAPEAAPAPMPAPPPSAPVADEFDDIWGDFGGSEGGVQAPPSAQGAPGVQTPGAYGSPSVAGAQQPDFSQVSAAPGIAPTTPPQFAIPGGGSVSAPPAFSNPQTAIPTPVPTPTAAPVPLPDPIPTQTAAPMPAPVTPQPAPAPAPPPVAPAPIASEGFGIGQPPAATPYPATPQAGGAAPGSDAFMRAFMEGAGITDASQLQIPPEEMGRIMGQIARMGTNELMRMLQDRAAVKLFVSNEDRTMRVATGNNPMKFMIDSEQAFEALFLKPRDGYLTGAAGFENALTDIRRHQAAVIAALQPALAEMLGGLSPEDIEADTGGGIMGGGARKAWDEFTKRWEARAAQGENGMLDAFIKAFSRHYADALRKM